MCRGLLTKARASRRDASSCIFGTSDSTRIPDTTGSERRVTDPPLRLFGSGLLRWLEVLRRLLVLVAYELDHLGVDHQPMVHAHRERLGVRLGIVDGHVDLHRA